MPLWGHPDAMGKEPPNYFWRYISLESWFNIMFFARHTNTVEHQ